MSDDIGRVLNASHIGPGTTPDRVAEGIERAKERRRDEGRRPAPTTRDREAFFGRIAEEIKRAGAGS